MKSNILCLLMLLFASAANVQSKSLVVYYSYTGNCQKIATALATQIAADVLEIQPAEKGQKYEANNYALGTQLLNAINAHPNDASSYPAIDPVSVNLDDYQNIFIVTPLWWSQMAAIMQTFPFHYGPQMAGKQVGLIVSSASSGISGVEADCKRLVPQANYFSESLWIRSSQVSGAQAMISAWLERIGFADSNPVGARMIKVSDAANTVTFELNQTSAAQSLYQMLPFEVNVENYGGNEKIFYPPTTISYGADCMEGDCPAGTLALFSPWGNVVMFYGDASRYSGLYILGRVVSGADRISRLSGTIRVEAANETSAILPPATISGKETSTHRYALQGRRALAGERGIIIQDGKKVVVK